MQWCANGHFAHKAFAATVNLLIRFAVCSAGTQRVTARTPQRGLVRHASR